jgi:chromosome segregation ATPase
VLAGDKASYDERVKKANAWLAEKEKEAWEQNTKKLAEGLEMVREEFREKAKSQEEHFTAKQKELKKELQDARSSLDKVTRAKDLATNKVAWLQEELSSLHGQIGPVTKIVEASQRAATEA